MTAKTLGGRLYQLHGYLDHAREREYASLDIDERADREFVTGVSKDTPSAKSFSDKLPILNTADRDRLPSKEQLVTLLELAGVDRVHRTGALTEGGDLKKTLVQKLQQCGEGAGRIHKDGLPQHGIQGFAAMHCHIHAHGDCPSDSTLRMTRLKLPTLEGEARYRSIWIERPVPLDGAYLEAALVEAATDWRDWVSKVAGRPKKWHGRAMSRSLAYYLDPVESVVSYRLFIQEEFAGEADVLVDELFRRWPEISVVGDKSTRDGETAVLQLMEDAFCTLWGMSLSDGEIHDADAELFSSWWHATERLKFFQSYGTLREAISAIEPAPKPTCSFILPEGKACGAELSRLYPLHYLEAAYGLVVPDAKRGGHSPGVR